MKLHKMAKIHNTNQNPKFSAMVVDRLCLYVFTIFIIATIMGTMLAAPYIIA